MPLRIIRMRIPLLTPGEIIVPCIRTVEIESDGEFNQKVANSTYARQLVFLLQNEAQAVPLPMPSDIGYHICQVYYVCILSVTIDPCHKRRYFIV